MRVQGVKITGIPLENARPTKPILDIAAAVATIDSTPEIVRRLTCILFLIGVIRAMWGAAFLSLSLLRTSERSICVVAHRSGQWREYLHIRDPLRPRPAATRKKICRLETKPCEHLARGAYTTSKADFIREVLDNSGNWTDASGNDGLG